MDPRILNIPKPANKTNRFLILYLVLTEIVKNVNDRMILILNARQLHCIPTTFTFYLVLSSAVDSVHKILIFYTILCNFTPRVYAFEFSEIKTTEKFTQ